MLRRGLILGLALLVAACGGGGGGGGGSSGGGTGGGGTTSSSSSSSSTSSATSSSSSSSASSSSTGLSNFTAITIDGGPSSLAPADRTVNIPYVTVTICVPGTATCQTIDHIILDTGSVGLRIEREVLNIAMLSGLPAVMSASNAPLAECYQYVDGYVWGSVKQADFTIGGESVANMGFMVIADDGAYTTVPSACSSGGGSFHNSVQEFGAKGILGIGMTTVDCGNSCAIGTAISPKYYACNTTSCSTGTTVATASQIPNPVAKFAVNNNGTVIDLPQPTNSLGATVLNGTLYFGIGTQTNNHMTTVTVLPTSTGGRFTATYKGTALSNSFIDSGTNFYSFTDPAITVCTGGNAGFYCAGQALTLSPVMGSGANTTTVNLTLNDTSALSHTNFAALVGLGGDPTQFTNTNGNTPTSSFDFGLPFFIGRKVYTGINGRVAETSTGPFVAF